MPFFSRRHRPRQPSPGILRAGLSLLAVILPPLLFAADGDAPADPVQAPAANTREATATPEAGVPENESIAIVDISLEASRTRIELRAIRGQTVPRGILQASDELPRLREALERIETRLANLEQHPISARWVSSIQDTVAEIAPRLNSVQKRLQEYSASLREQSHRIDAAVRRWETTRTHLDDRTPAQIRDEADQILAEIGNTRDVVHGRLTGVLSLLAEAGDLAARLAEIEAHVRDLTREAHATLLQQDSPPVWALFRDRDRSTAFVSDVAVYTHEALTSIKHYIRAEKAAFIALGLIAAGVLFFLLRIAHRHRRELETNPRLEKTAVLVSHPIAATLLVTIVLTPTILSNAPDAVNRMLGVVLLFPLLRLVKPLVSEHVLGLARGTILLYLASRVGLFFPEGTLLARAINLAMALFVLLGGIPAIRRAARQKLPRGRILLFALRLSVLLMGASAIANLLGFAVLAALLAQGVARAAFIGLALLCGLMAVLSFYRLLTVIGPLRHVRSLTENADEIDARVERALTLAAAVFWLYRSLDAFGLGSIVVDTMAELLTAEFGFGSFRVTAGSVLAFVAAIWIATLLSRMLRFFLERDVLTRLELPRGVPGAISMMAHYGIITIGIMIALSAAGISLSQLSIIIGALSVGIGFGLQNVVNNFVSGLILIFERPISVGDRVQFGDTMGEVLHIGIRASTIRTFEGAEIIVPNGNLISNDLVNWTLSDQRRRISVQVGVAYGTDPEKVLEILKTAVEKTPGVLSHPEPLISFDGFGESSLDFTIRCWIERFDEGLRTKTRLAVNINRALAEAGIEIPFPQRDLHIRSVDRDAHFRVESAPPPPDTGPADTSTPPGQPRES